MRIITGTKQQILTSVKQAGRILYNPTRNTRKRFRNKGLHTFRISCHSLPAHQNISQYIFHFFYVYMHKCTYFPVTYHYIIYRTLHDVDGMLCTPLQVRHICMADDRELQSTKMESSQMSWRPWRTERRCSRPYLNLGMKRQADRWHSPCRTNALLIQPITSQCIIVLSDNTHHTCVRETAVITRRIFQGTDIPGKDSSRSLEPSLSLICWLSLSRRSITQLNLRSKGQKNDVCSANYFRGSAEE
jgi:hypothetical protein